ITPAVFYAKEGATDPYMFLQLTTVLHLQSTGMFSAVSGSDHLYTPAFTGMMLALAQLTGIPVFFLQFLPIQGVVLPVTTYLMCREFDRSRSRVLLAGAFIVLGVGSGPGAYTTWVHGWGFVIFPLFIVLYRRLLMRPNWKIIAILTLLFVGVFFYSYTVNLWIVVFTVVGSGL